MVQKGPYGDPRHGPLPVPFTFALLPDLTIHRIWNGWYMTGRPTTDELRQTSRSMNEVVSADHDFFRSVTRETARRLGYDLDAT